MRGRANHSTRVALYFLMDPYLSSAWMLESRAALEAAVSALAASSAALASRWVCSEVAAAASSAAMLPRSSFWTPVEQARPKLLYQDT